MATNRTVAELLAMFPDGLPTKAVTPVHFQDMISSLHPMTGTFTGMPATPGNLAAGRLWANGDVLQMSLGAGPVSLFGNFRGAGAAGLAVATPRQRMLGTTQYAGRGGFTADGTKFTPAPPSAPTTFTDNFAAFDPNKWYVNTFDEGGDALWVNNPALTSSTLTYSNNRLHLGLLQTPGGATQDGVLITKPYISSIMDTWNPSGYGGTRFEQQYGYWEVTVAVDRFPGLIYRIDMLSAYNWPPAFSLAIWTDSSNVQRVFQNAYGAPPEVSTDSNAGWDASVNHSYGLYWSSTAVRFYRDRVLVGDFGNPGGPYTNGDPVQMKQCCQSNFFPGTDPVASPGSLPKYAHVDSINVWSLSALPF